MSRVPARRVAPHPVQDHGPPSAGPVWALRALSVSAALLGMAATGWLVL